MSTNFLGGALLAGAVVALSLESMLGVGPREAGARLGAACSFAPSVATERAERVLSREGGELLVHGALLVVPTCALPAPEHVAMRRLPRLPGALPEGVVAVTSAYELTKETPASFGEPVRVKLTYSKDVRPEQGPVAVFWDPERRIYRPATTLAVDR